MRARAPARQPDARSRSHDRRRCWPSAAMSA